MFKEFKQYKNSYLKHKSYKFENKGEQVADLYLFDEISPFGIDENVFQNELKDVTANTIKVHINSPGGSVFSGLAIFNMLKDHKAKVITNITGIGASIASVIALAGDEVHMAENSVMMIHKPMNIVAGNADEMRKAANVLDKVEDSIVGIYESKTGMDEKEIKAMLTVETWMNAKEAKELGFIDEVTGASEIKNKFDLSFFNNAPEETDISNDIRKLEAVLRDAGLSNKQAKALLSEGFAALQGNDETQRDADIVASLNQLAQTFN